MKVTYRINEKILKSIVEIERLRVWFQQNQYVIETEKELHNWANIQNLFHLAHMIGVEISIKDAEKALAGNKISTGDYRGTILTNYKNCIEYFDKAFSSSYVSFDVNLLLHINQILLADWADTWKGKIRTTAEEKDNYLENWSSIEDTSIEPIRVQNELINLLEWINTNSNDTHEVIKSTILLYYLMRLRPLVILNKVSIITFLQAFLLKNAYLLKIPFPLFRTFDQSNDLFLESALNAKENEDLTILIERVASSIALGMMDAKNKISKFERIAEEKTSKPFLDLNKRQLKILRYLQTIPTVRREDYVQMMNVSPMTSFRDLRVLVKKKLLKVEGEGRSTKYMLVNR